MPSPWGKQKKALLGGALGLAALGISAAVYYGFVRAPEQVVKYVEVTKTQEAEPVAAWLEKAVAAAREQKFTKPADDSALAYIQRAEAEHSRIHDNDGSKSKGAEDLRRMYSHALSLVGEELVRANLRHLAALKFKDALLFTPDDAPLASKSELSAEERARLRERSRRDPRTPGAGRAGHPGRGSPGGRTRGGRQRLPAGRPPGTVLRGARGPANAGRVWTRPASRRPSWRTPSAAGPTNCGAGATSAAPSRCTS